MNQKDILGTLDAIDVGLLGLTLIVSASNDLALIGLYFTTKNNTMEEYMLGGRRQKLLPVSLSMMASFISGLSLIGNPAEIYYHGAAYMAFPLGAILSVPITSLILLPVLARHENISIFNYLEQRYCRSLKQLLSLVFMVQMTLYNAVVLCVPGLMLRTIFGLSDLISIGGVGLCCIVYCALGGMKAVIWTDFFQTSLMYLSLLVICIAGSIDMGGVYNVLQVARSGGRLSFGSLLEFDLNTRHTLLNIATGATIINVFVSGANQIQVQRALSLPTLLLVRWSQALNALFLVLIVILSTYIGLILYTAYESCDPYNDGRLYKRDAILIYYVSTNLSHIPGLRGLFIAGIFAATLSTLSSFQNSMAALMVEDFIRPHAEKFEISESSLLYLSKFMALLFGVVCIGLSFVVNSVSGLLQVALTLFGALGGPMATSFLMGMTTRFTNSIGMLTGLIVGFLFSLYFEFYQTFYLAPLQPTLILSTSGCVHNRTTLNRLSIGDFSNIGQMSYLWVPVFSCILTTLTATSISLLTCGWNQRVDEKYLIKCLHLPPELAVETSKSKT